MKILIIGMGSMGKRRKRDLEHLGVECLYYDSNPKRWPEVIDLDKGLATADAVVVSTPPDQHIGYAWQAARAGKPFFTEAGVCSDPELVAYVEQHGILGAASATPRFQSTIRSIKETVDQGGIGRILAYTHHTGQYLPAWHPWEDYRFTYAAQRMTGGCRELVPFELCWLTWLAGPVHRLEAIRAKVSDLEADIDDVYQLVIEHESGVLGHLLVEVLSRHAVRRCAIVGERETIEATQHYGEETYLLEMAAFKAAVEGREAWSYPLSEEAKMIDLLHSAERA